METADLSHHISRRFNADLERVRSKVMAMGGLVEEQLAKAVAALIDGDSNLGVTVARDDYKVNDFHKKLEGVNGGGDKWHTDGKLFVGVIKSE